MRKALLSLIVVSFGVVWGEPGGAPPPNPLGAVAGALTTLLVDHVQARNEIRRAQRDGYAGGESEPGALPEPVPVPR